MALPLNAPSLALLSAGLLTACMTHNSHPDVHGHRGCRGLLPENTLPAFLKATELGSDYLELDVVISGDGQVVVSHEPWMSHRLCLRPNGDTITEADERSFNLYKMSVREIQTFDCGSLEQVDFPAQEPERTYKPVFRDVVEAVDEHAMISGVPAPGYSIEIKSDPELYGSYQPPPAEFVRIVIEAIDSLGLADRCIIQSFDPAILEAVNTRYPSLTIALLVENTDSWKKNLKRLTFTPSIYSPMFSEVNEALVDELHMEDIELIVWTVNEEADIKRMLDLGVDGIISDYPDRVMKVADEE